MKTNHKLTYAIMAALSAHAGASYAASDAGASSFAIEEVVVTATRRSESIQNVPITIQAITGDQLGQLNVTSFDDVLRYLPNVTSGSNGPGQGNIFMRGLSAGFAGTQSSATIAPYPNVATYLDEQAVSFPFRNADIYMVDMERLEVLEGPQGTLFGGGAEAGVVRYITNKPKLNVTEGSAEFGYGTTAHGDPNTAVNGVLNLPLITDKLALRLVAYNDKRGGYIDNVASTFHRLPTDPGPASWGAVYPTDANGNITAPTANNYALVQRAQNPVSYTGLRLSALYQVNDDWNFFLQQSYQNLEADGIFAQFPSSLDGAPLGPLQETSFSPTYNKDHYSSTAWTVNGRFGDLRAIYTGSYLTRGIDQTMDYTNYSRTHWGFYYTCTGGGGGARPLSPPTCYSPVVSWHDTVRSTHQSHEFRLSTPDEWRLRGLVGAFWENLEIYDNQNFLYKTVPACTPTYLATHNPATDPPCYSNLTPLQAQNDPTTRNDNIAFGEDGRRGYKQTAFFASLDYDLIPKVLTITGGTRWFRYEEDQIGSQWSSAGCVNAVPGVTPGCSTYSGTTPYGGTADSEHNKTYSGFKSRGNLTWHVTPDTMVYYTYSQGYRPGAFNRTTKKEVAIDVDATTGLPFVGVRPAGTKPNLKYQFLKPFSYAPDSLLNNEIGFKSEFLDHRVLLNASIYQMDWRNVQTEIFNPPVFGTATFGIAGPDYRIKGFELQLVARVTDALTVQGSVSYNDAKETNSPCITSSGVTSKTPGNPTPAGQCLSTVYGLDANNVLQNVPLQNALGALDATPAFSPKLEFNLRARYDWTVNDYKAFVMAAGSHVGEMANQPSSFQSGEGVLVPNTTWLRFQQPAYTTYDAAFGLAKDNWSAEVYGSNLSNSNASLFTSTAQYKETMVPLRPRVLGLKFGYKF